ncbi:MAG: alpha/beta fold hydrolase [bacterium]|nr:alpha/beta fold hydrolase [bacterium]
MSETSKTRIATSARMRWLPPLILLAAAVVAGAQPAAEIESQATNAARFAKLFLEGPADELHAMMTRRMQVALTAGQQEQIRSGLTRQYGVAQRIGEAWMEDVVQGYRRFRVPIFFAKGTVDFRVVMDGEGKVAGFFIVPHVEAMPDEEAPVREIALPVGDGDRGLPGILALPDGPGPFPAVVLVHGSGALDKDETIGPNKPFRDLAWGLAQRGVAVMRYDKRSHARPDDLVALGDRVTVQEEVIADARAALGGLRARPEIDREQIFVLGHSLGGMLAPRIAQSDPRPAGLVALAGSTLPLPEKILTQIRYIAALDQEISPEERALIERTEAAVAALRAALDGRAPPPSEPLLGAPFAYYQDLESYDPPAEAASLGLPILVVQGARDYQVTLEDFKRWQKALSGRAGACLKVYEGLDHLFRHGTGPSGPRDYERAAPMAPKVLDDLAAWVKERRCP